MSSTIDLDPERGLADTEGQGQLVGCYSLRLVLLLELQFLVELEALVDLVLGPLMHLGLHHVGLLGLILHFYI